MVHHEFRNAMYTQQSSTRMNDSVKITLAILYNEKNCDFAEKQAFRSFNFAICVQIVRVVFRKFFVIGAGDGCLCLALHQRAAGDLAYDLAAFCIDSASVGFAMLPCILTSTS